MTNTSIRHRLLLLTLFRVFVASVLLGATILFGLAWDVSVPWETRALLYHATGGLIVVSLVFSLLLERIEDELILRRLGMIQLVLDTVFASILVLITGGVDSVFTFFFSLFIINASIVLYRTGALVTAISSTILFLLVALVQFGVIELDRGPGLMSEVVVPISPDSTEWRSVVMNFTLNLVAFYAVAFLASYLAEQVRSAETRLEVQKHGLEQLRNLYQNIISSLENGLVTLDAENRVTFANDLALDWLGLTGTGSMGKEMLEIVPELEGVLGSEQPVETETSLTMEAGRRRYFRWAVNPLRDSEARFIGRVILFWDISEIKEMQQSVERDARMAAIGRLAASIAHEIRNPLASMSGSIQLLRTILELDGDEKRLMDVVLKEAEDLNSWITEFLNFTRAPKEPADLLDLKEICREVAELVENDVRAEDLTLELDFQGDCTLIGERNSLSQIVWNLVINAVDASPKAGTVKISLIGTGSQLLTLSVEDQGTGIPEDMISKIFDPFFSTKEMGTGLGLATVQRNVEQHRGNINLTSAPGVGTRFEINLPRRIREEIP